MDLKLRQLEAFVVIARLGSFTRAAQLLDLSQPALTKQIRQLEQTLSVRLLDRNTRSVTLTRIGRQLAPVVERLLREIDAVVVNTKSLSTGSSGVVAVAALPSICSTTLPPLIAKFKERYSGITVILRDVVTRRIVAKVKAEEVDLGIGSLDDGDAECRFRHLFADHMLAVLASSSALGKRRRLALRELIGPPLILLDPESGARSLVDRAFESIGHLAAPAYEVSYVPTALAMVRAGLGISVLPSAALEPRGLRGLQARPLRQPAVVRDIGIILKAGRSLSPAAGVFVEFLAGECRSLPLPAAGLFR